MQARKNLKAISIVLICALLTSCFKRETSEIDAAIQRSKSEKKDLIGTLKEGAPYFITGDVTPTFNANAENLIKLPEFNLVNDLNQTVQRADLLGKINVVAFFFTSCTGFCPTLIKGLQSVSDKIATKSDVGFVAVSVDPSNDSPEKLAKYKLDLKLKPKKNWSLLTGDRDTIMSFAKKTLSTEVFERQVTGPKSIIHSEHFFVFDQFGKLRGVFNGTRLDTPNEIQSLIAKLN